MQYLFPMIIDLSMIHIGLILTFVLISSPFNPTLSLLFQYGDEQLIHNDLVLFQYNHDKCFSY